MADWIEAIETIGDAGYAVSIGVGRTGLQVVTAIDERKDSVLVTLAIYRFVTDQLPDSDQSISVKEPDT